MAAVIAAGESHTKYWCTIIVDIFINISKEIHLLIGCRIFFWLDSIVLFAHLCYTIFRFYRVIVINWETFFSRMSVSRWAQWSKNVRARQHRITRGHGLKKRLHTILYTVSFRGYRYRKQRLIIHCIIDERNTGQDSKEPGGVGGGLAKVWNMAKNWFFYSNNLFLTWIHVFFFYKNRVYKNINLRFA